jgi:hypothetical protein
MVPRRLYTWNIALLVLLGLHAAAADAAPIQFTTTAAPIQLTGKVTSDFNPAANPQVVVTPASDNALNIGQPAWITANGWVSGWSIQDIRTYYNTSTDTLDVGINTHKNSQGINAPFGQANGDPSGTPTGYDPAHLGGDKSIAIAFAPISSTNPSHPGTPLIIAGVPADKTKAGTGTDGFTVSQFNPANAASGLGYQFGQTLSQYTGNLAFDPTPAHPQLEFTIKNFSKIPGLNPSSGFWIEMYAGSAVDGVGEAGLAWTKIPITAAQNIPEPAACLAWTLVASAAAWRFRSRVGKRS